MRISSKGEYGLRALFDLAQRYGEGPIQSHDIHQRQGIDENYLNQILILLRKAGLIESVRGPIGPLNRFEIEEMIDPRDTRRLACEWVADAYRIVSQPSRLVPRALQFRP